MSKHSRAKRSGSTAEQLTFFAAGFPVNPQASPESEKGPPIIAGSGLTFCAWCLKSNPCGCWRRILAESLHFALKECNSANGLRVSLRLEVTNCSPSSWLLKTLAHRSEESACSSWPTARATTSAMTVSQAQIQRVLSGQQSERGAGACKLELTVALQMWPTPATRDYKNVGNRDSMARRSQDRSQPLPEVVINGQPDPDSLNMTGRSRAQLNYRWVAQLQGFPSDWLDGIE